MSRSNDEIPILSDDVLSSDDAMRLAVHARSAILAGRSVHEISVERLCCYIIKTLTDKQDAEK